MSTPIAELEKRVATLEREMTSLRQVLGDWAPHETLDEADQSQMDLEAAWARVKQQMGITGEPIGAEKLQEKMLANGIKPEHNLISRGVIEMREE